MNEIETFLKKNNLTRLVPFVITMAGTVLVFLITMELTGKTSKQNDTKVALVMSVCFVAGIYIGRYIALLWVNSTARLQNQLLFVMIVVILILAFFLVLFIKWLPKNFAVTYLLMLFSSFFLMNITLGIIIKLVRHRVKARIENAEIKAANSETELQLLQSQLSPHFLFNTLNNLYGLSIAEHEKLPPLLLKLSELLRYSVYEAKETYVPLKDEMLYLENYIGFEKIRIGERLELTTELDIGADHTIKIAPMLLIVFVENAFKHSKNSSEQKIYIDITLKIWGNAILFSCINSYAQHSKENFEASHASGLGLANVKKRLELLYANEYDLKIEEDKNTFTVMLRLNAR